jgi:hypothetical protein
MKQASLRAPLLSILALLVTPAVYAAACSRVPVQAQSSAWIGEHLVVNGMPTSIASLRFKNSATATAEEFRSYWLREGLPTKAYRKGSEWTLMALDERCQYLLQLTEGRDGASGVFSASELRPVAPLVDLARAGVPVPLGGKALSDTSAEEPLFNSRVLLFESAQPAQAVYRQFLEQATRQGWKAMTPEAPQQVAGAPLDTAYSVTLQKRGLRLDAAIYPQAQRTHALLTVEQDR